MCHIPRFKKKFEIYLFATGIENNYELLLAIRDTKMKALPIGNV
jgi:hypothetical protein